VSVTEPKDTVMAGMVKQTEGVRLAFCLVVWQDVTCVVRQYWNVEFFF